MFRKFVESDFSCDNPAAKEAKKDCFGKYNSWRRLILGRMVKRTCKIAVRSFFSFGQENYCLTLTGHKGYEYNTQFCILWEPM